MANGNNLIVQYGVESTYGTPVVPTKQIKVASEGFKLILNKKDEGLLTGSKMGGRVATMSRKTEGTLSTLARPDDVGLFLACAFGNESNPEQILTSDAYKHTFTIGDDVTPSMTFVVDKVVKAFEYSGVKINSLSFNAAQEDYLKLDMNLIGKDEEVGTVESGLSNSPLKAFRFADAYVKVGGVSAKASSIKFDYNLNQNSEQTTSSGLYMDEPEAGTREFNIDAEVFYDIDTDEIRSDYFLTDDVVSVEIRFLSGESIDGSPYSLTFKVPFAQVTDASPTVGGPDRIKYNLQLKAVDGASMPTAELINGLATKYIA